MSSLNQLLKAIILLSMVTLPYLLMGQYSSISCQTVTDALIGPDRNDFVHNNADYPINEGYLHNFSPPTLPCGLENANVNSLLITVDIMNISTSADCSGISLFGNILQNCALSTTAVCGIQEDILGNGNCNSFGVGQTMPGTYSLDLANCETVNNSNIIGVDIVPSTGEEGSTCTENLMAISDGTVTLTYEICIQYTYDQDDAPCNTTMAMPCDDGDDCTDNDMMIVDDCDNTIICTPCAGVISSSCVGACVTIQPCNDFNPCTFNDEEGIAADGTICVACAGTPDPISCDPACTTTQTCNDGNPCTINDEETIAADGSTCMPCMGTLDLTSCDAACITTQPCNDFNPCTLNDMVTLTVNGGICTPCTGTVDPSSCDATCTTTQNCNDNNPCT